LTNAQEAEDLRQNLNIGISLTQKGRFDEAIEIFQKIIEKKIRPRLAADGGDIELVEVKPDNTVVVRLSGACGCCPFSQMTLKAGVEAELKKEFPENLNQP
jgi:pentatricopeptide repeat protein